MKVGFYPYASPALRDIRQIGPKRDRNISGICSACGTALLAWLEDSEAAKPSLPEKLDAVFKLMWLSAIRDPPVMHPGCPPRNAHSHSVASLECAAKFRLYLSDKMPVSYQAAGAVSSTETAAGSDGELGVSRGQPLRKT